MPCSFLGHQESTHHLMPTSYCKADGKSTFGTYHSSWTTPSTITRSQSFHRPEYAPHHWVNRTTYSYPSYHQNNYLTGEGKSHAYRGAGWYTPSERRFHNYHQHKVLPSAGKRDAIDFQSEDCFVNYLKKRDISSGIKLSGVPDVSLFGHSRTLPDYPPQARFDVSWPKDDAWFPVHRGDRGKYYGAYHEYLAGANMIRRQCDPMPSRIDATDIPNIVSKGTRCN